MPIDVSQINMLYVFVDIAIDVDHFVQSMKANFAPEVRDCICVWQSLESCCEQTKMVLAGTIQFASALEASLLSSGAAE